MLVKAAGHEDIAARFRAERAAAAAAKAAENSKAVESTPPPPEKTNKIEHGDKTAFYAMAMKRHAEKLLENERAKKANYPMFRTTDVDKNFAEFSTKCDGLMRLFGATGTLFVLDKVISKKVLSQGISFPGPLVVMFGLIFCFIGDGCVGERRGELVVRAGVPLVRAGDGLDYQLVAGVLRAFVGDVALGRVDDGSCDAREDYRFTRHRVRGDVRV